MTELTTSTILTTGPNAGPSLKWSGGGEFVYLEVQGPMPTRGRVMMTADDARVLAVCLAEWASDSGSEGA